MTHIRALLIAGVVFAIWGGAVAKLPTPVLDEKAKAAAEEKKAKDAAVAELQKQLQAKAEDRVAARYIAEQKAKGKIVTPQMGPAGTNVAIGAPAAPGAPATSAAPAAPGAPAAPAAPATPGAPAAPAAATK